MLSAKEVVSFRDLLSEFSEINQIRLNFGNWEINKHTSDLWCFVFTGNLFYVFIDEFSDLTLVVRVSWGYCWYQSGSVGVVLNKLRWQVLHVLLNWHVHWSWESWEWSLCHSHLLSLHSWVHLGWHLRWLVTHWSWHIASWVSVWSLLLLLLLLLTSLSGAASVVAAAHSTLSSEVWLSLNVHHQVLNKLNDFWSL